ncbi:MAG: nickel pincer cofactor biosynthesis protein LarB [Coriobacteriaceae bacterium]|nr:nickel pincer cofactor biosynthesis protein LarB [Coriobacteriaceae bacterium]
MDARELERLARAVAAGEITPDELVRRVRAKATSDLGYACVDQQRGLRTGVPEVIYGAGKTAEQIAGIVEAMRSAGEQRVLITRLDASKAQELQDTGCAFTYHAEARMGVAGALPEPDGNGEILILSAGTSDGAVAAEAELTARFLGNRVRAIRDVGVAGIHRLLAHAHDIASAQVIIAIAGMEGALPSVVGGLASCPVIAVPTSVGYGASFGGLTALLAMVNSCASGVSVVNIDNGFGAAFQASLINHLPGKEA